MRPIMSPHRLARQVLLILCFSSGCAVRMQPSNQAFDQVAGRGPLLLVATDASLPSSRFFEEHRRSSSSLGRLIDTQGVPEAISVEREFLQPTKMRLLYPNKGQVYVLSRQEGQWFVVASEALTETDIDLIQKQKIKRAQAVVDLGAPAPGQNGAPTMASEVKPVAHVAGNDFRGRLKPPMVAREAVLTRTRNGNYVHQVSFEGEDLSTLAEWYTDDPTRAKALAAANHRGPKEPLRLGERIVIPAALITNPSPLPEAMVP